MARIDVAVSLVNTAASIQGQATNLMGQVAQAGTPAELGGLVGPIHDLINSIKVLSAQIASEGNSMGPKHMMDARTQMHMRSGPSLAEYGGAVPTGTLAAMGVGATKVDRRRRKRHGSDATYVNEQGLLVPQYLMEMEGEEGTYLAPVPLDKPAADLLQEQYAYERAVHPNHDPNTSLGRARKTLLSPVGDIKDPTSATRALKYQAFAHAHLQNTAAGAIKSGGTFEGGDLATNVASAHAMNQAMTQLQSGALSADRVLNQLDQTANRLLSTIGKIVDKSKQIGVQEAKQVVHQSSLLRQESYAHMHKHTMATQYTGGRVPDKFEETRKSLDRRLVALQGHYATAKEAGNTQAMALIAGEFGAVAAAYRSMDTQVKANQAKVTATQVSLAPDSNQFYTTPLGGRVQHVQNLIEQRKALYAETKQAALSGRTDRGVLFGNIGKLRSLDEQIQSTLKAAHIEAGDTSYLYSSEDHGMARRVAIQGRAFTGGMAERSYRDLEGAIDRGARRTGLAADRIKIAAGGERSGQGLLGPASPDVQLQRVVREANKAKAAYNNARARGEDTTASFNAYKLATENLNSTLSFVRGYAIAHADTISPDHTAYYTKYLGQAERAAADFASAESSRIGGEKAATDRRNRRQFAHELNVDVAQGANVGAPNPGATVHSASMQSYLKRERKLKRRIQIALSSGADASPLINDLADVYSNMGSVYRDLVAEADTVSDEKRRQVVSAIRGSTRVLDIHQETLVGYRNRAERGRAKAAGDGESEASQLRDAAFIKNQVETMRRIHAGEIDIRHLSAAELAQYSQGFQQARSLMRGGFSSAKPLSSKLENFFTDPSLVSLINALGGSSRRDLPHLFDRTIGALGGIDTNAPAAVAARFMGRFGISESAAFRFFGAFSGNGGPPHPPGFTGPGSGGDGGGRFGRRYDSLFNYLNRRVTNLSQLAQTPVYGMGTIGAAAAMIGGSLMLDSEASAQKSVLSGMTNSQGTFYDAAGNMETGLGKFIKAQKESEFLYKGLRKQARDSLLTTREMVQFFSGGAGMLIRKGINPDQSTEIVDMIATVGKSLGLQEPAIISDIRDFSNAKVNAKSQVLNVLGLDPAKLKEAFASGGGQGAYNYFKEATAGYGYALDDLKNKPISQYNKLLDSLQQLGIEAGAAIYKGFKPGIDELFKMLNAWNSSQVLPKFAQGIGQAMTFITGAMGGISNHASGLMALTMPASSGGGTNWGGIATAGVNMLSMAGMYTSGRTLLSSPAVLQTNNRLIRSIDMQLRAPDLSEASMERLHAQRMDAVTSRNAAAAAAGDALTSFGISLAAFAVTAKMAEEAVTKLQSAEEKRINSLSGSLSDPQGLQRTQVLLQNLKNVSTTNQANTWSANVSKLMEQQAFLNLVDEGNVSELSRRFSKSDIARLSKDLGIPTVGGPLGGLLNALGLSTNVIGARGRGQGSLLPQDLLRDAARSLIPGQGPHNPLNSYGLGIINEYVLNAAGGGFNLANKRGEIAANLLANGQITKSQFQQSVDSVVSAQDKNQDPARKAEILKLAGTIKKDIAGLSDVEFIKYAGDNSDSILKLFSFMFPQYGASSADMADAKAKKLAPNFGPIIDRLQGMFQATSKYAPDAAQAVLIPTLRDYQTRQALGEYRTTMANLDADPSSTDAQRQAALQKYYDSVHGFSLAIEQMTFQVKEASIALKEETANRKAETAIIYQKLQAEKASVSYAGLMSYTKDVGAALSGAFGLYDVGLQTLNKQAVLSTVQARNERNRIVRGAGSVKSFKPISSGPALLPGNADPTGKGQVDFVDPLNPNALGATVAAAVTADEKDVRDKAIAAALDVAIKKWFAHTPPYDKAGIAMPQPSDPEIQRAGDEAVAAFRKSKAASSTPSAASTGPSLSGGIGKGKKGKVTAGKGTGNAILPPTPGSGGTITTTPDPMNGLGMGDPTADTSAAASAAASEAARNADAKYAADRGQIVAQHAADRYNLQRSLMGNLQDAATLAAKNAYLGGDVQSYMQTKLKIAEQGKFAGAAGVEQSFNDYVAEVGRDLTRSQSEKVFSLAQTYSSNVAGLYADYRNILPKARNDKQRKEFKQILDMQLASNSSNFQKELEAEFARAKQVVDDLANSIRGVVTVVQQISDVMSIATREAEMRLEARGETFLESPMNAQDLRRASELRIGASTIRTRAQQIYQEKQKEAQSLMINGGTAGFYSGMGMLGKANKEYLSQMGEAANKDLLAGLYKYPQAERDVAAGRLTESIKLLNEEMQRLATQGLSKSQSAIYNLTGEQMSGVEAIKAGYSEYVAGGEGRRRASVLSMTKAYDANLRTGLLGAALLPMMFGKGGPGIPPGVFGDAMLNKYRNTPGYQQGVADIENRAAMAELAGQRSKLEGIKNPLRDAAINDRMAAATSAAFNRMMTATNFNDAILGGVLGMAGPYQTFMQEQNAAKSSFMANAFKGTLNSESAQAMGYTRLKDGTFRGENGRIYTSKQLGMRALEDMGLNFGGQMLGSMTTKWFGNQSPEITQAGISIGGALGPALFAGLGKFGGPVGMVAGGLLGSLFGGLFGPKKDEMDPQEKAWRDGVRKSMNELVDLIRPISDVYKVYKSDVLFGPASFAYSGRLGTALAISRTSGYR